MLVVAGAFKRAEPDLAEDALLMRALRDFNIPKIVREDEVVFFGLLGRSWKCADNTCFIRTSTVLCSKLKSDICPFFSLKNEVGSFHLFASP